jgi:hypothetical protein
MLTASTIVWLSVAYLLICAAVLCLAKKILP